MSSQYNLVKGDTVLVTGFTGLIGSVVSSELASRGFKVRGVTYRMTDKAKAMVEKMKQTYGPDSIETVIVEDGRKPDAYKEALQGVAGVIHIAIDLSIIFNFANPDYETAVNAVNEMAINIAKTAATVPTIKSFVMTSSNSAIYSPPIGDNDKIELTRWNDEVVELAKTTPNDDPGKTGLIYAATKTESERALWKWVDEAQPKFNVNAIVPACNLGTPFNPAPGSGSTSDWIRMLFKGQTENNPLFMFMAAAGGVFLNVKDCAIIHVAALLDKETNHQRIWAAHGPAQGINDFLAIFRKAYPEKSFLPDIQQGRIPTQEMDNTIDEALLQKYAGRGYLPFEESVLETVST